MDVHKTSMGAKITQKVGDAKKVSDVKRNVNHYTVTHSAKALIHILFVIHYVRCTQICFLSI